MRRKLGVSERRACRVLKQPRTTQRYMPKPAPDERVLTERIIELAGAYGRYGYRRVTALLGCVPKFVENRLAWLRAWTFDVTCYAANSSCWSMIAARCRYQLDDSPVALAVPVLPVPSYERLVKRLTLERQHGAENLGLIGRAMRTIHLAEERNASHEDEGLRAGRIHLRHLREQRIELCRRRLLRFSRLSVGWARIVASLPTRASVGCRRAGQLLRCGLHLSFGHPSRQFARAVAHSSRRHPHIPRTDATQAPIFERPGTKAKRLGSLPGVE